MIRFWEITEINLLHSIFLYLKYSETLFNKWISTSTFRYNNIDQESFGTSAFNQNTRFHVCVYVGVCVRVFCMCACTH